MTDPLVAEQQYLSRLLEAIQRCVYFLDAADTEVAWPLSAEILSAHRMDKSLFGALAALNERFAKLQDTLGAAMRHAAILLAEPADSFLQVLAFYEKAAVLESTAGWQQCRLARNLAAHAYETEYAGIAEHFNTLHRLEPLLMRTATRFIDYCGDRLSIRPEQDDFAAAFAAIVIRRGVTE